MKHLCTISIGCLLLFMLSSCGGNTNNCAFGAGYAAELSDEVTALSEASTTYGNDPSPANCEEYRAAYRDYLEALKSLRGCYDFYGNLDEYNESIEDLEQELEDLDCQ